MTALPHITLDTGHVRQSPRSEVGDETLATLRASLAMALEQPRSRIPVPMQPGYSYGVTAEHGCLLVTIYGTVQATPAPVVTFGVAAPGSDAGGLWRILHDDRGGLEGVAYRTDIRRPPRPPWVAARMEFAAGLVPPTLWLADFERCIAWAWLEMQE